MKPEERAKLAEASAALDAKRGEAKVAWKNFEDVKRKALSASPEDLKEDGAAFKALDEAGLAYDTITDEINRMDADLQRLGGFFRADGPAADGRTGSAADISRGASGARGEDGRGSPVDVESFMEGFRAWRDKVGGAIIGDPRQQFGSMPAAKLIDRSKVAEVMNATVTTTSYPSVPFRRPGIVPALLENLDVLDVITFVPTDSAVIQYVVENPFTNAAVETAETNAAPEGTWNTTLESTSCKWIPFTIPQSRQILSDEPRLQAFIQGRIAWGVRDRLQNQVINGDGNGENLLGIINTPNILDQLKAVSGSPTQPQADAVHKAKTKIIVQTKGMYSPSTFCIHPTDLETLVLIKDTMGRYLFGGPQQDGIGTIWGMRPIAHPLFTIGEPFVADMAGCEGYIREDVSLSVTDSHSDHFVRGIIDFLASGRFGFAVLQPKAFCSISNFGA